MKTLYVSLNLGCSGRCELCPTRGMIGCDKITIENLIDWDRLKKTIEQSNADTICLIGGENPLNLCSGHRDIYKKINEITINSGKILAVVTNYEATYNTDILDLFDYLYILVPKNWKKDNLKIVNTLYLKSYVGISTFVEVDKVTDKVLSDIKLQFFKNPIILLDNPVEKAKIPEYLKKYGGLRFTGRMIDRKNPIYSLTENKYYKHSFKSSTPWRDLLKVD